MRREHFPALVAFGGVVVDDFRVGQEHGLSHFVQAADQVEVLEVHEKTIVKKDAVFRDRGKPYEHEAPAQARRVHRPVVPRIHEAVAGVLPLLPFLQKADGRDEAAEYEVGRRGEQENSIRRSRRQGHALFCSGSPYVLACTATYKHSAKDGNANLSCEKKLAYHVCCACIMHDVCSANSNTQESVREIQRLRFRQICAILERVHTRNEISSVGSFHMKRNRRLVYYRRK